MVLHRSNQVGRQRENWHFRLPIYKCVLKRVDFSAFTSKLHHEAHLTARGFLWRFSRSLSHSDHKPPRGFLLPRIRAYTLSHVIDVREDVQRTSMQKGTNILMSQTKSYLMLPDAPAIPGLAFRLFQGEADFPAIKAVRESVQAVDGDIWLPGPDTDPDPVCNPLHDCLFVEVDGQVIGYTWLVWWTESDVELFLPLGGLVPGGDAKALDVRSYAGKSNGCARLLSCIQRRNPVCLVAMQTRPSLGIAPCS